jgi:hypothetical protein
MQLAGRSIQRGVGSLSSVDRSTGRRLDIVEIVVARLASYYMANARLPAGLLASL